MKKILAVMPFETRHREYLENIGKNYKFHYTSIEKATLEEVQEADIILGNVKPEQVRETKHLEWIQLNSAGYDVYAKPGILHPGTILSCATGAYGLSVADGMLSTTYMLCRKMDLYIKNQVAHCWKDEGKVTTIWNSTTLVLGLGDIGREYAKRMKMLGSYVIGVRRNLLDKPEYVDELCPMEELDHLLPRADFVAMVLPSTQETYHIMDERRLRLMKKGSYLINAGRGDAVDCDALDRVLREGVSLGGCALDVTEPEPLPADHPLWDAPRTIITPHIAGKFHLPETFERIVRITGNNLEHFLVGEIDKMQSVVSLERL